MEQRMQIPITIWIIVEHPFYNALSVSGPK